MRHAPRQASDRLHLHRLLQLLLQLNLLFLAPFAVGDVAKGPQSADNGTEVHQGHRIPFKEAAVLEEEGVVRKIRGAVQPLHLPEKAIGVDQLFQHEIQHRVVIAFIRQRLRDAP